MIKVHDLAFSYSNTEVLKHISLEILPGKIYGLLGENGVGKTTLLTLLAGLKKPQQGSILADSQNPYSRKPEYLTDMYFLPDELAAPSDRAISWARSNGKFWKNYSQQMFEEIMSLFETDANARLSTMSTGQLKKTYISFALACRVKYLFMDEPTNGLDIPSKAQFRSVLLKYTGEETAIVISTHQVRDLENIIDPIVILDKQDVLLNASVEQITSKLFFDYGTSLHPESLYSEQLPGAGDVAAAPTDG